MGGESVFMIRALLLLLCLLGSSLAVAEVQVAIKTNLGDITLALDDENAPVTVANFLRYVDDDGYDETVFHRVVSGYVIQGGRYKMDLSDTTESSMIRNEADNGLKNLRGTIAMARYDEIDSASKSFFINLDDNAFLDHAPDSCTRADEKKAAELRERGVYKPATCRSFGYAVFGKVVSGMDVVDLIEMSETRAVATFDDVPVNPVIIMSIKRLADGE